MNKITVSAPGRICLFGEHQDYLGCPVIPMAINLRVTIYSKKRDDKKFVINLPDIDSREEFEISQNEQIYTRKRDYFKSIFNVLKREGYDWKNGWDCEVRGNIPINSGTSSSSALNNVWCKFLIEASSKGDKNISDEKIAYYSYLAEVIEFGESGGMMDQYSTAVGNLFYLETNEKAKLKKLECYLGYFVLGDSLEPKNTEKILSETKEPVLSGMKKLLKKDENFTLLNLTENIINEDESLTSKEKKSLIGAMNNRKITEKAFNLLSDKKMDEVRFGNLLTKHHFYLNEYQNVSTPKINKMLSEAIKAGALGGKINGSGGGGCMFVYAPENPEKVKEAIENCGAKAYIIKMGKGLEVIYE